MTGLYIHIPFCRHRCIYCAFCSTTQKEWMTDYVAALDKEMQTRSEEARKHGGISTIYLGGGTPSTLSDILLHNIFDSISRHFLYDRLLDDVEEITLECNPDDVTPQLAAILKEIGINRVSLGVQTFNDERLRWLHRRHTAQQVNNAVRHLKATGIDNISIDLIYGFPQQTEADWHKDIQQALALQVPHISAYCLTYEEGTPLWNSLQRGEVKELEEAQCRTLYYQLADALTETGYDHYEISNFALPNRRARHNTSYWQDIPYIGIGAAAHSYDKATRRWNTSDIRQYIELTLHAQTPYEEENIDIDTHFNDLITTTLRTTEGLPLISLEETFPQAFVDTLMKEAQPWIERGWLTTENNYLRLTRNALFVSDTVLSDLVRVS